MSISMMPSDEFVRYLREFRDVLLGVARQTTSPASHAASLAAAKLDNLALDTAAGKRTRTVIDLEFGKVLLSLADKNADVFAALLADGPAIPDDILDDVMEPEPEEVAEDDTEVEITE
jgi:hypothetical protein